MKRNWRVGLGAGMVAVGLSGAARAATIAGSFAFTVGGSSANVSAPTTTVPNNDNSVTASPNTVNIAETFDNSSPIDIVFNVSNSGGTTEYFFTKTMANTSGQPISGVILLLGTGTGDSFAGAGLNTGLDFDWPDKDPPAFSPTFTSVNQQPTFIAFSNGVLGSGTAATTLTFSVDVPDGIGNSFTLRELPTIAVPEPGIALAAGGLGMLLGLRRRREA